MASNASQNFYNCKSCGDIYLLSQDSANFCPSCGKSKLEGLDGRFILRCRKCGLTQNKRAFSALHGKHSLKCQASKCGGNLKTITIKPRKKDKNGEKRGRRATQGNSRQRELTPRIDNRRLRSQILTSSTQQQSQTESLAKVRGNAFITSEEARKMPKPMMDDDVQMKDHQGVRKGDHIQYNDADYIILKKLGVGGMGAVWLAENTVIGSKVAIKEFYYSRYNDPETGTNHCEKYWIREAEISKLQSESPEESMKFLGSIKIDKFTIPEFYIILEFIDGKPLDEWYTDRYKNISDLTITELQLMLNQILMPISKHLYFCHQKGIVHRDLTVQNILIKKTGENSFKSIVIDWGVAKQINPKKMYNPKKPYYVSSTPEATGIRNRGSPPEVMAGYEPISVTDIYMMGHIMFYLFSGGNYARTAATHEDFVLHALDYNPTLPDEFNKIVEYMTQYEPADRMPNMIKVYEALKWLEHSSENIKKEQDGASAAQKYYLYSEWNEAKIPLPEKEVFSIGRDQILDAGLNHDMDGHLHKALVPAEDGKFQFSFYIDGEYLYVRDLHSFKNSYIFNLTASNQQVYNNIPIKGLDNVVIILSDANLGKTTIKVIYDAPDGQTYKIPFTVMKNGNK